MRQRKAGVELDGPSRSSLGCGPLPVIGSHRRHSGVSFGEVVIHRQSLASRLQRPGMNFLGSGGTDLLKARQGICQPGTSGGVVWVQLDGLLEVLDTFREPIYREPVVVIAALAVSVIDLRVDGTA